ncbi:MAG: DUF2752 domain-containing protein [Verrucomicrobiales bacterium]|nr:DUF2752 domain-containing protein [Verrucomicrobiales bacterium]
MDTAPRSAGGLQPDRWRILRSGLLILSLVAIAVLAFDFALAHTWPLPGCPFENLTGHPCAFCGGCRTLALLGSAHPLRALGMNPFVALSVMATAAWGGALVCDGLTGSRLRITLIQRIQCLPWMRLLMAAMLLNWFYLLVRVH